MIKLYGGARSRASLVQWYLEELNLPYQFVLLDMSKGEHLQEPFLSLNPFGKVPVLVDGDFKIWESGAILIYIAQKYGHLAESPEITGEVTQWVLFANATLGPGIFNEITRAKELPRLMTPLNELLAKQPYILGEEFTVVDVAVGSMLAYIPMLLKIDLKDYPAIVEYMAKISARPAFIKAIIKREQ